VLFAVVAIDDVAAGVARAVDVGRRPSSVRSIVIARPGVVAEVALDRAALGAGPCR